MIYLEEHFQTAARKSRAYRTTVYKNDLSFIPNLHVHYNA